MLDGPRVTLERPPIGVTTAPVIDFERPNDDWKYGQKRLYIKAIREAGGDPYEIPFIGDLTDSQERESYISTCSRMAGFVLAGGNDLDPRRYGDVFRPGITEPISVERDESELLIVELFDRRLPLLGICRGMHVINVARGGSLHQEVTEVFDGTVDHRNLARDSAYQHLVSVMRRSKLGDIVLSGVGDDVIGAGSLHHQAIDVLGRGLIVVARASDELIEAIEDPEVFTLGVQWHPEDMKSGGVLFESLVNEARNPGTRQLMAA